MTEIWPKEWLLSWPENIQTHKQPGVSCIFITLNLQTMDAALALQQKFRNDTSVSIHEKVAFPGILTPGEAGCTPLSYEPLQIMQVDFFRSSAVVVFKTEKLYANGMCRAEGYYLEIKSKHGHILWRFPIEHVYQSYTEWI